MRRLLVPALVLAAAGGWIWAWRHGGGAAGGFLLGVVGTAAVQAASWAAVRLLGSSRHPLALGAAGAAVLLKLPLLVALWVASRSFGSEGPNAFAAGLVLVYSGTLAWALLKR